MMPLPWREIVLRRLTTVQTLPPGWDGYDGLPVRAQLAACALQILDACCGADDPPPQVVPGVRGDLQLEWHLPQGDIELHILAPAEVRAWYRQGTPPWACCITLTTDFTIVAAWLAQLQEPPDA